MIAEKRNLFFSPGAASCAFSSDFNALTDQARTHSSEHCADSLHITTCTPNMAADMHAQAA